MDYSQQAQQAQNEVQTKKLCLFLCALLKLQIWARNDFGMKTDLNKNTGKKQKILSRCLTWTTQGRGNALANHKETRTNGRENSQSLRGQLWHNPKDKSTCFSIFWVQFMVRVSTWCTNDIYTRTSLLVGLEALQTSPFRKYMSWNTSRGAQIGLVWTTLFQNSLHENGHNSLHTAWSWKSDRTGPNYVVLEQSSPK